MAIQSEAANEVESGVIELPLHRTPLPRRSLEEQSSLSSLSTIEHEVANHDNYAYSTTIYVGSNRQPLNVLLDSGSSVMWL